MASEELSKLFSIQQSIYNDATQLLFNSLNQRIEDQNKIIYELKHSLEFTQAELLESKSKLAEYIHLTDQIKENTVKNEEKFNKLQLQIDLQEDQSRYNNIRIEGMPEKHEENAEQTQQKVLKLLNDKMQLNNIAIDKIHRLPQKQNITRQSQPRTIIARLQKPSDRNMILKNSFKLKNTGIFINDDVSEGTMRIRKEKIDSLKEARRNGKAAFFVGRRLVIHDRNRHADKESIRFLNSTPQISTPKTPTPQISAPLNSTPKSRNSVSDLVEMYSPNNRSQKTTTPRNDNSQESSNSSHASGQIQSQRLGLRRLQTNVNYKS